MATKTAFLVTDSKGRVFSPAGARWDWSDLRIEGALDLPSAADKLRAAQSDPKAHPRITKVTIDFSDLSEEDQKKLEQETLQRVVNKLTPDEYSTLVQHFNRKKENDQSQHSGDQ